MARPARRPVVSEEQLAEMEWLPQEEEASPAAKAELARFTPRERRAAYLIAQGYPVATAMREAGYRGSVMSTGVRELLVELMDEAGLSDEDLLRTVKAGLTARQHGLHQKSGEAIDLGPDWNARARFTELAFRLRGRMGTTRNAPEIEVRAKKAVVIRHTPRLS